MREVQVRLDFQPYSHQREAHELRKLHRFMVLVWHRRAGKTVFAVLELILAALACQRERGRFGYVAPYLKQAKKIAWDYLEAFTREIPGRSVNLADLSVTLPNGAKIELYGADNPDSIRGGYFDGVVLDEVADMKPMVWGEIVSPMLLDRGGWAIFLGTPKGINLFSELYYSAIEGDTVDWYGDMRRASETGVYSQEELASTTRNMTPQQIAQEFECDFAAAVENALIPLPAVLEAQERQAPRDSFEHMPKILGIDVARQGGDRSCFYPRQGIIAFKPKVMRIADSMELAGQAALYIDQWKPDAVFIDNGTYGASVADRLRQLGHSIIAVDFGGRALNPQLFRNRRVEMWWQMAEWVKSVGCLPKMQELVIDLTAPTYSYAGADGRMSLESKDDMRARGLPSPDVGDALALTFAAPVPIRTAMDRVRGDRNKAIVEEV